MTRFEKLAADGRTLTAEQVNDSLRSLAMDDRFAAVVAWLERNKEAFVVAGCKQSLAKEPGKLAHAQGSVHTVMTLQGQIAHLLTGTKVRGGMEPDE
jgi:hypothetical protein